MNKVLVGFCLVLGSGLVACGEVENLHDMKDSTKNMEQTTGKMAKTTEGMAQTTDGMATTTTKMATTTEAMKKTTEEMHQETKELGTKTESMKNTTNELYDALRQGNALQLRREAWDAMLKAPTMFKKISEAGKYFMSFEVQLWNNHAQDITLEKRDVLAQQATKEFFLEVEELAERDGSFDIKAEPNPFNIHSMSNRQAAFNAIAVAMHQYNRKQLNTITTRSDAPLVTMQTLMTDALLAKELIQKGQSHKLGTKLPFIREVLAHEAKAIQLLRVQMNFAPLMFIDAVTQIKEKWLINQAIMVYWDWTLDLDKISSNDLEYYSTELLEPALKSKDLLNKLGLKPELVSPVNKLLANMKIHSSGKANAYVAAQQTRLVGLLRELAK